LIFENLSFYFIVVVQCILWYYFDSHEFYKKIDFYFSNFASLFERFCRKQKLKRKCFKEKKGQASPTGPTAGGKLAQRTYSPQRTLSLPFSFFSLLSPTRADHLSEASPTSAHDRTGSRTISPLPLPSTFQNLNRRMIERQSPFPHLSLSSLLPLYHAIKLPNLAARAPPPATAWTSRCDRYMKPQPPSPLP
jgi:hypothetical protein